MSVSAGTLELFSTCPASSNTPRERYLDRVADVARWSERHGCRGMLVYSDNRQVDPWLVAQYVIHHTTELCPLVAVQPVYMHPYSVAKLVASVAWLHGRRVCLNLVAGGFKNDLEALNDSTEHDRRYERLTDYATLIGRLLSGAAVTHQGAFYGATRLKLTPPVPPDLSPGLFVSGSSAAGVAAARAIGATAVKYPRPPGEEEPAEEGVRTGVRIGIVAREGSEEAWRVARLRFPPDRRGQLAREMATRISDSFWHRQITDAAHAAAGAGAANGGPYWLEPFEHYQTMCPYLVGSYDEVAGLLARYLELGHEAFILDIPTAEDDLYHARTAFERAAALVRP